MIIKIENIEELMIVDCSLVKFSTGGHNYSMSISNELLQELTYKQLLHHIRKFYDVDFYGKVEIHRYNMDVRDVVIRTFKPLTFTTESGMDIPRVSIVFNYKGLKYGCVKDVNGKSYLELLRNAVYSVSKNSRVNG